MNKLFQLNRVAIFIFAFVIISCEFRQKNKISSEQSNDSAFVFTTPKVINIGDYLDSHFEYGRSSIQITDTTGILSLSDIAEDVEYVLLKTKNDKQEVFIGKNIDDIFICKDYIFVQMTDNIIQYDRQGNLIRTIGRKGGGPGEYNWVYTMSVDDKTKKIIINTSGKINEYDFDGKFIRSQKNTYDHQLMLLDSNRIAVEVKNLWHDVKERLVILNRKGEVEKSFPRYKLFEHVDHTETEGNIYGLSKFHDMICFKEEYNDTIFELKGDTLQMRYFIDWGKCAMKPEYYYEKKKYGDKMGNCFWTGRFHETNRYLFTFPNKLWFTLVYDKKTDQINVGYPVISSYNQCYPFRELLSNKAVGFNNDIDGGMVQNVDGISLDCQYIFSYYHATDVKDFFEEVGYDANSMNPDKQAKLKALVETIDEDKHNLFIMISKLKE